MAALTDDQTLYLRDHLGDAVDLADAQLRYDRLGELDAVVVEVLQRRIANLVATPAQFSVAGEYSQNTAENLKALQAKLADFAPGATTSGGMSVVRVVAPAARPAR